MRISFSKRFYLLLLLFIAAAIALFQSGIFDHPRQLTLAELKKAGMPHIRSSFSPKNRDDAYTRHEYEMRRLRDPQTGRLPDNIRALELNFARNLPTRERLQKDGGAQLFVADWVRRGPINVGGRTRALAIDLDYNGTSNQRILAGAVSGGIFLSTDGGATWQMTTTPAQLPSATCLAQDPNDRNVWYYGTGEWLGSTFAGARSIPGQGIFKSTDGGSTWAQLPATAQGSLTRYDNSFDFVWNLAISPQGDAIFAATLGYIMRSTDGGNGWETVLAGQDFNNSLSLFTDVVIAANGDVYAALSRNGTALSNRQYGVFRSSNNGDRFTVISPPGLTTNPYRMVLAAAPSDPNTLYLLVQAKAAGAIASDHQFFRYHAGNKSWTDLSTGLPNESGVAGNASFCSQGGYDLVVKVKPDNANVVWIGGTNLYRSTNGGQSFTRVGGYTRADDYGQYQNHHSDQHAITFYPNNPNAMISGHDGGLAKTTNVLAQPQTWTSLNNGYIATQFYTVAVDPRAGSDFITGGMQDNGSWGTDAADFSTPWAPLLSGDGAYTDIVAGGDTFYVSAQQGIVVRARRSNNQLLYTLVQPVTPNGYKDFLFIAPFQLDPNDRRVMYLAAANVVWRNSNLDAITVVDNLYPVTTNWSALNNSAIANTQVTTLAVSKIPANRLYFGATDYQAKTVLVRVNDAPTNPAGTNITPAGVPGGAYPSCLAVNPNNADEIIAVFSNYRIPSLWHSTNGGASWTDIEGNLAGDEGPSMRWASIVPTNNGKVYFLATSTGVYSTTTLDSANTLWVQEGSSPIGNAVVDMIAARPADGVVVVGTHGRGVYSTRLAGGGVTALNVNVPELNMQLKPGTTQSVQFNIGNTGTAALNYNITATGPAAKSGFTARINGVESNFIPNLPKFDLAAANAAKDAAPPLRAHIAEAAPSSPLQLFGNSAIDLLVLDDGNDTADKFMGLGANASSELYWLNSFTPSGFGFRLEAFDFYMRTEDVDTNPVYVAVYDANGNTLAQGNLTLPTSSTGSWYTITIDNTPSFSNGERFSLLVGTWRFIPFPAGTDLDAAVPNQSFYFNPNTNSYDNLNTISGFENAAFLIRAKGTKTGVSDQPPIARAQISPNPALINQDITFDGSASSDPDGQISQYLWNFGDGMTSTQSITTHAYAQAGTYTYTLTVTDTSGATGQTSGQIDITATPSRLAVNPASGTVAVGGSQTITVTLDAQGLAEGNYQAQLSITSNGGSRTLPVWITISNSVNVEENNSELPRAFVLEQNYPNPFWSDATSPALGGGNPETTIRFSLPSAGEISLMIYDIRGRLIRSLAHGTKAAGEHLVQWDGKDSNGQPVASGVYFYRLEAISATSATTSLTKKMTIMK